MAAEKKKPLSDEEVLSLVEKQVNMGVGFCDSKLSAEREKVLKYYNSTLPAQQNSGRSSYRSTDVYDSVEAMKAQLLETFAGNPDNLVSFPPQGPEDVSKSRVATEYTNYQVFRLNDGYGVMHDAVHDGLTARVGITKVFWEERFEDIEERFDGAPEMDVQALAAREDVVALEADEVQPMAGVFNGKLTKRIDRSQVCLLQVPPEEFVITQNAKSIKDARIVCHRTLKGKDELIKEGYDPKKVMEINWADARSLDLTGEKLERQDAITDQSTVDNDAHIQPETEKVMFYESFTRLDMYDGRGVRLWKVCHAGRVLLSKEEVDRAPFIAFVPLPIPHIFHGNSFAFRVAPTQNARTVLTRAILDHASVTTNPRWQVVKGALLNPKEMQDNRLGGLVNVNRPDGIVPLEQHNLNPFVFQTLEMLKANKEESTGISALSQGLNKDAISTQNSAALVDNLVTLSQQRQKIIARNFAYGYLVPLYLEVYRLVLENEKAERIIEIAGQFEPVNVADWVERQDCKVALHLGYGERDRQTKKLQETAVMLASDPGIATMYGPQNRYALYMDIMRSAALENAPNYITSPDKAPPPQPDPLKVKELEIKDKAVQATLMGTQAKAQEAQAKVQLEAMRIQIEQLRQQLDAVLGMREADRQDADVANRIDVAQRETELLEQSDGAEQNAIISPNS
jgi:hypothetical protein